MDLTDASAEAAQPGAAGRTAAAQERRIRRRIDYIFKLLMLGVLLSLVLVLAAMSLKSAF